MEKFELDTKNASESEWLLKTQEFSHMLENLDTHLDHYYVKAKDVGWQRKEGERIVNLKREENKGAELIKKITPNSSFRLEIEEYEDFLEIQSYHHDNPTGEIYEVYSLEKDIVEICENQGELKALNKM